LISRAPSLGIRAKVEDFFDLPSRHSQAKKLAAFTGVSDEYHQYNAIEHAYVSATLQRDWGARAPNMAAALGNAVENDQMRDHVIWRPISNILPGKRNKGADNQTADSWKDLWNNAIGRQIGEYVRKNSLSQNDLERLIMQAHDRGDLIK
jgi:hypothetical protein